VPSSSSPAEPGREPINAAGFAGALAELALSLRDEGASSAAVLARITDAAATTIPGADCAAVVVLAGPGELAARAAHGNLPAAVMALENATGQGPCLDTVTRGVRVWVSDVTTDDRWPLFRTGAAATGARAMICTPLAAGTAGYGSLSLISSTAGALDAESADLAGLFAVHAAIALAGSESLRQLHAALSTRDLIGQAKGVLMERHQLTADAAFALLVQVSQDTNTKLRDVAGELCRTGALGEENPARRSADPSATGSPERPR
jgi:GAF domain-containing protein